MAAENAKITKTDGRYRNVGLLQGEMAVLGIVSLLSFFRTHIGKAAL